MQIIDEELLNKVTMEAKESLRLRKNYNFHDSMSSPSQRLLNAVEPGSLLPIHRHMNTSETYVILRGKARVYIYNNEKKIMQNVLLDPLKGNYGGHIPIGQWHSLESLESGTVIYESKDGPYIPVSPENVLK